MAHECPECYSICYCKGDVDDCLLNFEEDVIKCVHWRKCEPVAVDDDVWQMEDDEILADTQESKST